MFGGLAGRVGDAELVEVLFTEHEGWVDVGDAEFAPLADMGVPSTEDEDEV